eukprot:7366194-Pyramimonas_sp.AAC.1
MAAGVRRRRVARRARRALSLCWTGRRSRRRRRPSRRRCMRRASGRLPRRPLRKPNVNLRRKSF